MNEVIAVIPAFNEEEFIESVILKAKYYADRVIVVDDGSQDNTGRIAERTRVIVLSHLINLGKGSALRTGVKAALKFKPEFIVVLDADGQHNPEDIPRLINLLKENDLDIVIGSRTIKKGMPLIKRIGNSFIYELNKFLFDADIKDTQSGFKAFKSNAVNKIKWNSNGYSLESEMAMNIGKNKLKFKETPIQTIYSNKYKGTSVLDGIKIFLYMLYWKVIK